MKKQHRKIDSCLYLSFAGMMVKDGQQRRRIIFLPFNVNDYTSDFSMVSEL